VVVARLVILLHCRLVVRLLFLFYVLEAQLVLREVWLVVVLSLRQGLARQRGRSIGLGRGLPQRAELTVEGVCPFVRLLLLHLLHHAVASLLLVLDLPHVLGDLLLL